MLGQTYPRRTNFFLVIVYLIFIFYFINYPFSFVKIPEIISKIDKWIIFAGGILLLVGVINYIKVGRRYY